MCLWRPGRRPSACAANGFMLLALLALAGCGGEGIRNALKHRDQIPPSYQSATVSQLINLVPLAWKESSTNNRNRWSPAAAAEIAGWESRGVTVQAYIVDTHYNVFD